MGNVFGLFSIGFLLATGPSCVAREFYICRQKEEEKGRVHRISWNDHQIFVNHITFSRGTSRIQITPEKIAADTVQDTQHVKLERPDGTIVPYDQKKIYQDVKSRGYATTYSATVPVLTRYVFDRKDKTLEVILESLPPHTKTHPKRVWIGVPVQEEYRYNPETKRIHPKHVKNLSEAEAIRIFPPETTSRHPYPVCREKSGILGIIGHWIDTILFP